MAKPSRTFRDSVIVVPAKGGWCWTDGDAEHKGFKRAEDAKADAERAKGKIDWTRKGPTEWHGAFGPHYTASEWLARST